MPAFAPVRMEKRDFTRGLDILAAADPRLAKIIDRCGKPAMWTRKPGFATLVHIILEQQVSLASARATFARLEDALGMLSPQGLLGLSEQDLAAIGFSRQKALYCRILAQEIQAKRLDLNALTDLGDDEARKTLTAMKGIGAWTANCYLMLALRRPDIWPVGDLALAVSVQKIQGLEQVPKRREMETIADDWRPWRSVAARILWHDYLNPES